jgi:ribosomal-protein-serine acetyltransferase
MLKLDIADGIELKALEKRHLNAFFAFVEKGRAHFENWIPFVSSTTSIEIAEKKIDTYLELVKNGEAYFWCIWEKTSIIGLVLIKDIDNKAKTAEVGYMIDEEYEGKGIVKKACKLMIDFLFIELQINKIVLSCDEENEKSVGIAKRFGFELEGILKQNIMINGKIRNTMCWALFNAKKYLDNL